MIKCRATRVQKNKDATPHVCGLEKGHSGLHMCGIRETGCRAKWSKNKSTKTRKKIVKIACLAV